jgi:hypothetical protein
MSKQLQTCALITPSYSASSLWASSLELLKTSRLIARLLLMFMRETTSKVKTSKIGERFTRFVVSLREINAKTSLLLTTSQPEEHTQDSSLWVMIAVTSTRRCSETTLLTLSEEARLVLELLSSLTPANPATVNVSKVHSSQDTSATSRACTASSRELRLSTLIIPLWTTFLEPAPNLSLENRSALTKLLQWK